MFKFRINTNDKPVSQSDILIDIERLVSYILKNQSSLNTGIHFSLIQHNPFDQNFYQGFYDAWPKYVSVCKPTHEYSELITAFWRACTESIIPVLIDSPIPTLNQARHLSVEQVMDIVRATVRHAQDNDLKRKAHDRLYEAKHRQTKLKTLVRSLIQRYPKLLVVRVDYAYLDEHLIDIDEVFQDFKALIRSKYTHASFGHLVGSAWAIEQGQRKGYHIHAVYFFDGNKCQRDMFYAKEFGELWKSVTKGKGYYYNCNADKAIHEERGTLGIGMIHRQDAKACENAISAVGYLTDPTKEFQHLRMKPNGARTFATGMIAKYGRKKMKK